MLAFLNGNPQASQYSPFKSLSFLLFDVCPSFPCIEHTVLSLFMRSEHSHTVQSRVEVLLSHKTVPLHKGFA